MNGNQILEQYRVALIERPLSHVWRGHGTAIMFEFGALTPKLRSDGTPANNPDGELSLMIEWTWRIEHEHRILSGSSSKDAVIETSLKRLLGKRVLDVTTFGRLPELQMVLSDDLCVVSFATEAGDPEWALMDHRAGGLPTLISMNGTVCAEP
ncbi:hypothetical protein ASG37_13560 [Sphingomonas sp. Leaf407]|uniref:hypothetical protein n=1 Tax=unclassified Sphingomonas TaxID=196159 RepID=UPI00070087FD|nr:MULTISPECIES: hypothetical protein [unclassified Sphingomonas]KQN36610.1 hypothetical protein ASE97_12815 [Sphingomonas sp. Leaf42]KQT27232.1 hypothetical protein ASG37_13560 [Sphingomonas sp. Leaf407]